MKKHATILNPEETGRRAGKAGRAAGQLARSNAHPLRRPFFQSWARSWLTLALYSGLTLVAVLAAWLILVPVGRRIYADQLFQKQAYSQALQIYTDLPRFAASQQRVDRLRKAYIYDLILHEHFDLALDQSQVLGLRQPTESGSQPSPDSDPERSFLNGYTLQQTGQPAAAVAAYLTILDYRNERLGLTAADQVVAIAADYEAAGDDSEAFRLYRLVSAVTPAAKARVAARSQQLAGELDGYSQAFRQATADQDYQLASSLYRELETKNQVYTALTEQVYLDAATLIRYKQDLEALNQQQLPADWLNHGAYLERAFLKTGISLEDGQASRNFQPGESFGLAMTNFQVFCTYTVSWYRRTVQQPAGQLVTSLLFTAVPQETEPGQSWFNNLEGGGGLAAGIYYAELVIDTEIVGRFYFQISE